MAVSRTLPAIITFSIIALVLAGIAALLPRNEERPNIDNFRVEYELGGEPIALPGGEDSIFDFLKFELNPIEVGPAEKIARSRQPINRTIALPEEEEKVELVRSPVESVVIVADNSTEILTNLAKFLEEANEIRSAAVKSGDSEKCDSIENEISAQNCRDEIYFQKAVAQKNISFCSQIVNFRSQSRCENYVKLIPENEIES